jgi:tetratricopeptide (TPR) repeat protein
MTTRGGRVFRLLLAATLFALTVWSAAAQTVLEMARTEYDAGHYQQAVDLLRGAAAQYSRDASFYNWLARCEFELREYDPAVVSAERAVELEPSNSDYHLWLGRAYGRKAEEAGLFSAFSLARKSRREFEEAVRLNPSSFEAQEDLIEFYLRAPGIVGGGEEKALQQIEALTKVDAIEAHLLRAKYLLDKKKTAAADVEVRAALDARPTSIHAYIDAAEFYERRKDRAGLQRTVEGGMRIDPTEPHFLYFQGVAAFLAGIRNDEAEQSLKRYLETIPPRSDLPPHCAAREWLGQLYEREGRTADAITQYRAAIAQDAHCKKAHDSLRRLQR